MPATLPEPSTSPATPEKAESVRRMFGAIARRYDLLNHLLSMNRDRAWRRKAVDVLLGLRTPRGLDGRRRVRGVDRATGAPSGHRQALGTPDGEARFQGRFLDGCAGTFDFALELERRPSFTGRVVAFDFSWPMMREGRHKLAGRAVEPVCADALRLPFRDAEFSGATVGFGVRNLADIDGGLRELARVLEPGARLVILEFTTPRWQPFRALYLFYFLHVLPRIGRLISGHNDAYAYLPRTVLAFPEPPELARRMSLAGFREVGWETYFGGVVAAHVGERTGA